LVSTTDFDALVSEFHRRVAKTIWCTLATVDTRGRARTRVVHPVWDGPAGWLGARAGTPKLAHIAAHPDVSLLYWDPDHEQVTIDARATVEPSPVARSDAWAALQAPAPPYGFDPAPIWPGGPDGDDFVAIRLVARRVELFGAPPVVWKASVPADQERPT
jgi:hypothetical protein